MRKNPVSGIRKMHNGIDLVGRSTSGGSCTDYVKAHTGGTVAAVGYSSSAGNYVQIQVSPSTVMVYYHLKNRSTLKTGARVKKGDVVGYMGSTGTSTGAHLHWGIKRAGVWIDPAPYLDKDYTEEKEVCTVELPVLKKGAKGDAVKALQTLLIGYGYNCGKKGVDGSLGDATDKALRKYQGDHKLTVDGSCGPKTWTSLLGA
jgi:hypothetical protein